MAINKQIASSRSYVQQELHYNMGKINAAGSDIDASLLAYYYERVGWFRHLLGYSGDAIGAYKEAIRLCPDNHDYYMGCGNCYFLCGNYEKALEYFNKSLDIHPYSTDAYSSRAETHEKLGNSKLAAADFKLAESYEGWEDC
ncbi:MAG: tetratricopeptide repeat protein [Anaerolineae bacterium]